MLKRKLLPQIIRLNIVNLNSLEILPRTSCGEREIISKTRQYNSPINYGDESQRLIGRISQPDGSLISNTY